MNKVARQALAAYGMADARLTFLTYHGNVIYRVDTRQSSSRQMKHDYYVPGRYVLRIHMLYHSTAAITSELQWLSALRRDLDLPVPVPIPDARGELVTEIDNHGVMGKRQCSLLRWVDGRFLKHKFRPAHARAWGRLMAQLHGHAARWRHPSGFTRRHRDWDGLFGENAGFEHPPDELWTAIPRKYREKFGIVTDQLRKVMSQLGTGPEVYGLVHADLDVKTNILFGGGDARVIDFDDCCFAYLLHDLAFALSPWWGSADYPWIRNSLLKGYGTIRVFPESQLKYLNLFVAAYHANLLLWMIDWAKSQPQLDEPKKWVNDYGNRLLLFSDKN